MKDSSRISPRVTQAGDRWDWLDDWVAAAMADRAGDGDGRRDREISRRDQAVRRRDAALRELAATYYPRLPLTAQARMIRQLTVHYAATAWRRDRRLAAPPPHYADAPHELLWRAFAAGAPLPVSERWLCGILRPRPGPTRRRAETRGGPWERTTPAMI